MTTGIDERTIHLSTFIERYVPEELRYIDNARQLNSLYSKLTGLFEDVLSGKLDEHNFMVEVDQLYQYWDTIRYPETSSKVRELLDPYDLSGLIIRPEDTVTQGRFMYYVSDIWSIKGTLKAFQWILKLVGMNAQLIRWYEPEYTTYRPAGESCWSVLKIFVGDQPITDQTTDVFQRLVDLTIDICTQIVAWVYVKQLTDVVPFDDRLLSTGSALDYKVDRNNRCSNVIALRALDTKRKLAQLAAVIDPTGKVILPNPVLHTDQPLTAHDDPSIIVLAAGDYAMSAVDPTHLIWPPLAQYEIGIHSVHSDPFSTIRQVGLPELNVYRKPHVLDHHMVTPCTVLYNSHASYESASRKVDDGGYTDNLATAIVIADPIIRYSADTRPHAGFCYNDTYVHDQRLRLPTDYYDRCFMHGTETVGNTWHNGTLIGSDAYVMVSEIVPTTAPVNGGATVIIPTIPYPTYGGEYEPLVYPTSQLAQTQGSNPVCVPDVLLTGQLTGLSDQFHLLDCYDGTSLHTTSNSVYGAPTDPILARTTVDASHILIELHDLDSLNPDINLVLDQRLAEHLVDQYERPPVLYDGVHTHAFSEAQDQIYYDGTYWSNPSPKAVADKLLDSFTLGGLRHISKQDYTLAPYCAATGNTYNGKTVYGDLTTLHTHLYVYEPATGTLINLHDSTKVHSGEIDHEYQNKPVWDYDYGGQYQALRRHNNKHCHDGALDHSFTSLFYEQDHQVIIDALGSEILQPLVSQVSKAIDATTESLTTTLTDQLPVLALDYSGTHTYADAGLLHDQADADRTLTTALLDTLVDIVEVQDSDDPSAPHYDGRSTYDQTHWHMTGDPTFHVTVTDYTQVYYNGRHKHASGYTRPKYDGSFLIVDPHYYLEELSL